MALSRTTRYAILTYRMVRCPVPTVAVCLRTCYEMPGIDIACGVMRLRACYAMSGTDIAYQMQARTAQKLSGATSLRAAYAMCGTDLAITCYAISGTDLPYGAMACYAMCGTDIASGPACLSHCSSLTRLDLQCSLFLLPPLNQTPRARSRFLISSRNLILALRHLPIPPPESHSLCPPVTDDLRLSQYESKHSAKCFPTPRRNQLRGPKSTQLPVSSSKSTAFACSHYEVHLVPTAVRWYEKSAGTDFGNALELRGVQPLHTAYPTAVYSAGASHATPEIKYKKPHSWYRMRRACGFLYLTSGCTSHATGPATA
eukprot:3224545-Rhodomonas_salina.2